MKTFKVTMIEHDDFKCQDVTYKVIVEAEDEDDACETAEEQTDRGVAMSAVECDRLSKMFTK